MKIVQLLYEIRKVFALQVRVSDLYSHDTVRSLGGFIESLEERHLLQPPAVESKGVSTAVEVSYYQMQYGELCMYRI